MDLKPSNLLIKGSDPPILKVADFGFAQHLEKDSKDKGLKGEDFFSADLSADFLVQVPHSTWLQRSFSPTSMMPRQTSGPLELFYTRSTNIYRIFKNILLSGSLFPGNIWSSALQQ